ncbi:MAG: MarR family transcriptional regulator [Pseudomonadota bacterium]
MLEILKDTHHGALDGIGKLEGRVSFRIAVLSRLLDRQMSRILADYGLTLPAYRILVTIDAFGEISAADLVRVVVVDKGVISRSSAELEHAGLLETRPDPRHARRKLMRLTETGKAKLAAVEPDVRAREQGLDGSIDPADRDAFDRSLAGLSRHVAEALEEAPGAALRRDLTP